MEDVPNLYIRKREPVKMEDVDGEVVDCWLYALPDFKEELLTTCECLPKYKNSESWPFVARKDRTSKDFYGDVKQ